MIVLIYSNGSIDACATLDGLVESMVKDHRERQCMPNRKGK